MIKRERYIKKIRPFMGGELIKVLTGMRRSGKSVMLNLIKNELREQGVPETQFITFNFESLSNAEYCTANALYQELKRQLTSITGKGYLFFDEIQEVENWEKCINSVRVDFDCDIYITGSNAKLLSGELATYLGGRYVEFTILPFSFEEYIEYRKETNNGLQLADEFKNYLYVGGMPFITTLQNDKSAAMQYLRDIYNSIILKDVVKRNKIRDVDLLERIIAYVLANIGHTFSAGSISNYFKSENRKVSPETILNYIRACCDAYLFFKLKREDIPGKKILTVNEKYYAVDHGIRQAVFGGNTRDIDQILENVICMELIRRGYNVTIGKYGEKEIDFIASKNSSKIYIQVAYLLSSNETIEREFGAYDMIRDNYPKYVLTLDDFDMSRNGIKHLNIRDFLLTDDHYIL